MPPGLFRRSRTSAVDARRLHLLRRKDELEDARVARPANVQARLLLAGVPEQSDDLFEIERRERVAVDRDDLVAGRQARPGRGGSGERLQHDHAAGQDRDDAPEPLTCRALQFLELVELLRVEEDGMRVQTAQQARDRAFEDGLVAVHGFGRRALHPGEDVDEALQLALDVPLFGRCRSEQQTQRGREGGQHQVSV
jgi:hypothetical protein